MRFVLLGIVFYFAVTARLGATIYYIDYANGNNANAGTNQKVPWKHCPGDPAATGLPAAAALQPGDIVMFRGGVTYVFTGATGIALNWNGSATSAITYDGNSRNEWGPGRAKFTDNYGGNSITAFFANQPAFNLVFKSIEIAGVGGAPSLPLDQGSPLPARFGGGIAFHGGAEKVLIQNCVFRELGYWFNQKPMSAASLAGVGILSRGGREIRIYGCTFSRMVTACDISGGSTLAEVEVKDCTFGESIVWKLELPAGSSSILQPVVSLLDSIFADDGLLGGLFGSSAWSGYGHDPRTDVVTIAPGGSVTYSVAALATPAATFQWRKNGQPIPGATLPSLRLNSVTAADAGSYTVVATNLAGSTSSNPAILNVGETSSSPQTAQNSAPVITQQPVDWMGAASSNVTFMVAASGVPAPTFQWFKNGAPIAGATNATLTLENVSQNDVSGYNAVATNVAGSASSATVRLTIVSSATNTPPAITQQPASRTAAPSSDVMFTAAASGTPAPTYQWLKNGTPITGKTNATLILSSVTSDDAGFYSLQATNVAGQAVSVAATLTIFAPVVSVAPAITQQPSAQTVTSGAQATFTAAASGTPTPTLQWMKNGAAISGATNATLILPNVTSADQATYRLVATNVAGSASSDEVALTVSPPPVTNVAPAITQHPNSQSVAPLVDVTFVGAATGTPTPTYQWLKNGAPMEGATNPTLTLFAVTSNDAASYSLRATNAAGGAVSSAATLTVVAPIVNVAPTITQQPSPQTVASTAQAMFTAAANGTPAPTYQWLKNGTPISGATGTTLTLQNVTASDQATYRLVATNIAGTALSDDVALTVLPPVVTQVTPTITQHPTDQIAATGSDVTFSAAATGTPAPSFQWFKNGAPISGWTNATLTLRSVASNDVAGYHMVASNTAGTAVSATAMLGIAASTVNVAPVITKEPVSQWAPRWGVVSFTVTASGTPAPTYQWMKNGAPMPGRTSATLILEGVSDHDVGIYSAAATNDAGTAVSQGATLGIK